MLRMIETAKQFRDKIISAIKKNIINKLSTQKNSLENKLRETVLDAIRKSPEFQSLNLYLAGELAPELGFVKGSTIQDRLLSAINNALKINYSKNIFSKNFISITISKQDLLSDSIASYMSSEYEIAWLRWLIESGTQDVIIGWHIEYNINSNQQLRSRSGLALMESEGSWSVPAQYAGTDKDNFISRAINIDTRKVLKSHIESIL